MFTDNHKNSECAFAEPLVAYLYDEIGAAEKVKFETHLESCSTCRSELTAFGLARSAVQEWRVEEFEVMPTPFFELPSDGIKVRTAASEPRSWFAGWRQIFAFKPALAMSVSAIVIVLFVAAFLIFNRHSDQEIAGAINNINTGKIAVSPTVDKMGNTVKTPETARIDLPIVEPSVKATDKKSSAAKTPPVKVSANQPKVNFGSDASLKSVPTSGRSDEKRNAAPKPKAARLIETEDEEDDSVRLADLFDEIGTR